MKRGFIVLWFAACLVIGGWAWWYLFTPGSVPEGQPPLADETAFREAFHKGVSKNRIVAVLSPTTPADLATAQHLQALLMEYENDALDAHVVWQAMAQTDWAPTTDAMARVWDPRVRHYWDKERTLRPLFGEGRVLLYSRGAGFDSPALRVMDLTADLPKIRAFLGTPKKQQ